MLLNIDKPCRTAVLHTEGCARIPDHLGTEFKLREKLGRDGGWFTAKSELEARRIMAQEFPKGEFRRCSYR